MKSLETVIAETRRKMIEGLDTLEKAVAAVGKHGDTSREKLACVCGAAFGGLSACSGVIEEAEKEIGQLLEFGLDRKHEDEAGRKCNREKGQ